MNEHEQRLEHQLEPTKKPKKGGKSNTVIPEDHDFWKIANEQSLFPDMLEKGLLTLNELETLRGFFDGEEKRIPESVLNRLSIGVFRLS